MGTSKSIRVTCKGAMTLPIDRIVEFQGTLKKLSKKNLEKLKKRIIEDGFNVPFFVWDNAGEYMIMDGHGRLKALLSLREEGYDMPLLPVAIIEASDITDARKKLLAISSQYGEFDVSELGEWLSDMDASIAETLRLVDTEMALDMDDDGTEEQSESERGGSYNDEKSPEIDAYKLAYRVEAISQCVGNKSIELYAGRGILSYWYNRKFEHNITNDIQSFEDTVHDYTMSAMDCIDEIANSHSDFCFIDFDDEGCPSKEIQYFFKKMRSISKDKFTIAITDGQGLNFKCMGRINFNKTYMIREDKTVQATLDDYYNFSSIFREFIENVCSTNGYKFKELGFHRKNNGNVIYATYFCELI